MTDKIKEFVKIMESRGHSKNMVIGTYIYMLNSEDKLDKAIQYLKNNPNSTKSEDNTAIHKIYYPDL